MERSDINCVHCTHVFDLDNLTKERRRSVTKKCSDVDIINVLSTCYNLEEVKLRNYFGYDTCTNNFYICTKCFNVLKAISACRNKYEQLADNLKSSASSCFKTLSESCIQQTIHVDVQKNVDAHNSSKIPDSSVLSTKKRQRAQLTPSKSGCTPKAKRLIRTPSSTPKKNRRRLHFKTPHKTTQPTNTDSPGPKVKVIFIMYIWMIIFPSQKL